MDQCKFCTVRGDIKACEETNCGTHDDWYAKITKKALSTALTVLATKEAELKKCYSEISDKETIISEFGKKLIDNQLHLDIEFQGIVSEEFWNLM